MRITKLYIKDYKNLKDFNWDINPDYPISVIVGKNASGKTNLLEAIVNIFQQVILHKENPEHSADSVQNTDTDSEFEFAYRYGYNGKDLIEIQKRANHLTVRRNHEKIPLDKIASPFQTRHGTEKIMPENIFLYYAGISNRFNESLKELNAQFRFGIRDGKITGRTVISYEPIHYKAVMLALLLSPLKDTDEFLARDFGITGLREIRIFIGKPRTNDKGDENSYWEAPAIIKSRIDRLRRYASVKKSERKFGREKQWNFLFNAEKLGQDAIRDFNYEFGLFQILDSLYVTHYLKGIEICFKKEGVTQPVEFDQLSEGEKQRLAICGAMEIFRGKETLFLLDEPEAFAHPFWQWDLVPDLQNGDHKFSQVIVVTHSPIVITTLSANVFIMRDGKISPMNKTFGLTVDESLAEQNTPYQQTAIADQVKNYLALIQEGKARADDALQMRLNLEDALGKNHPELRSADDLIALYE
ncbi:AAA family ATPase [Desulfobacterales bacterium HSG2]|nr:AAA family ATPase [Desulfobacterales bacterium HSG2]